MTVAEEQQYQYKIRIYFSTVKVNSLRGTSFIFVPCFLGVFLATDINSLLSGYTFPARMIRFIGFVCSFKERNNFYTSQLT